MIGRSAGFCFDFLGSVDRGPGEQRADVGRDGRPALLDEKRAEGPERPFSPNQ